MLSPISGASRFVGTPHKASVGLAHQESGGVISVNLGKQDRRLVRVELIHVDYETRPDKAAAAARQLVQCQEVAALIGPVNSDAVEQVLENVSEVPVISALATAPKLTRELHKPNFFRLIFNDSTRMQQYASFIAGQDDPGELLVLYDESSSYGRGLCSSFQTHYKRDAKYLPWSGITGDCLNRDEVGEACSKCASGRAEAEQRSYGSRLEKEGAKTVAAHVLDGLKQLYSVGGEVSHEPMGLPKNPPPANEAAGTDASLDHAGAAVILGSTAGALPMAHTIRKLWGERVQLYLVGSSRTVIEGAPRGAITIGDPKIDPYRAETDADGTRWTRVLQMFELVHHASRDDFIPTAFDAYQTVHEALESVLANANGPQSLDDRLAPANLRNTLLRALRTQEFNSIESWRKVAFDSSGELVTTPMAPIYQISRGTERIDDDTEHSWVEVVVNRNQRLLWGPVTVSLRAHGFAKDYPVELFLTKRNESEVEEVKQSRTVRFVGDRTTEDFYLLPSGEYFVRLQGRYQPANPRFDVRNTHEYVFAAIIAILVAIVVARYERLTLHRTVSSVAWKAFATVLLLFLLVFLNRWIEFPFLSGSPRLTAIFVGVLGGAAGPSMVAGLLQRLTNRFSGGERR